jgi:predicted RNA-binding Zn ribbon-like protein
VITQEAPGELERVRELLNTWLIPNDTRVPTDRLPPTAPFALRALRDDLRAAISGRAALEEVLNDWISRLEIKPVVAGGAVTFEGRREPGEIVCIVLRCIAAGAWPRLKACPDCQWVFYDHTRNGAKRWCLMNAGGPAGRSCGSIAKVRRHRERALGS